MPQKSEGRKNPSSDNFDMAYSLLASGKRIGMSFDEINYFTVSEFYDFLQVYIGDDAPGKKGRRQATQEDIDRMYK